MKRISALRLALPTIGLVVSFVALASVCLVAQQATKKPSASKGPSFPMSTFSQAKPDDYLGAEVCEGCHKTAADTFNKSPHALYVSDPKLPPDKKGCEACHGPGKNHLEHMDDPAKIHNYIVSPVRITPKQEAEVCLRCHADAMTLTHWRRSDHARANVRCSDCHYVHKREGWGDKKTATTDDPSSVRQPIFAAVRDTGHMLKADEATLCGKCHQKEVSEFRLSFHHPLPEGRILCSDCHEPHPNRSSARKGAAQTRVRSGKEMCVTCHAETAGPFAYEHDPAAGWSGDACMECHRPHGSHNPRLLKMFSRGLCMQCHTDKAVSHYPGRTCWDTGCHVAHHGSNTDQYLLKP